MNKMDNSKKDGVKLILACAVLTALFCMPVSVNAAEKTGPGSERSQEEWARLRDDTLEYEEIRGLTEEYNAEILEKKKEYRSNTAVTKNAEQTARALQWEAEEYEEMALEAEAEVGGETAAAEYRIQAEKLRQQAAESTDDGSVIYQEYLGEVTEKVREIRNLFADYYEACDQITKANAEISWKERELYYTKLKYEHGLITYAEVTSAQESLKKAQESVPELQATADNARRDLITACGWKYDAQPVIGPLPSEQQLMLTEEKKTQDLQLALSNSSTLTADRQRLENAERLYGENSDVYLKMEEQLEKDTLTVTDTWLQAAEKLQLVQQKLSTLDASLATVRKALTLKQKQLKEGTASKWDVEKAQYEVESAEFTRKSGIYDLMRARHNYDAICEGAAE